MLDWIFAFGVGLVVGWNFFPQPLWVKGIVNKIFKSEDT